MPLKACHECKHQISSSAARCPNCGADPAKSPGRQRFKAVLYIAGAFVAFKIFMPDHAGTTASSAAHYAGASPAATPVAVERPPPAPPTITTPSAYFSAYHANEIAADAQFKGRQLAMIATVQSIDKNAWGQSYLKLRAGDSYTPLMAQLDAASVSFAATLSKGDLVAIQCQGGGMLVGVPMLHECQFVDESVVRPRRKGAG